MFGIVASQRDPFWLATSPGKAIGQSPLEQRQAVVLMPGCCGSSLAAWLQCIPSAAGWSKCALPGPRRVVSAETCSACGKRGDFTRRLTVKHAPDSPRRVNACRGGKWYQPGKSWRLLVSVEACVSRHSAPLASRIKVVNRGPCVCQRCRGQSVFSECRIKRKSAWRGRSGRGWLVAWGFASARGWAQDRGLQPMIGRNGWVRSATGSGEKRRLYGRFPRVDRLPAGA